MINFDDVTKENIKEHNLNRPKFPDHSYRTIIIGGTGSGKTNSLFNLIGHQPDNGTIYLYAKDLYKAQYQMLINKPEGVVLKYCKDSKDLFEYSNDKDNIYKNIEEYNLGKQRKILTVFDDMIGNVLSNEKLNPLVTELSN